jgi:hypothetical protein
MVAAYGRPRETKDADLAISTASVHDAHAALTTIGVMVVEAFSDHDVRGRFAVVTARVRSTASR